jgi:hypothetical protein
LVREQAFLPAGQEDRVEFQPLGGMERHQAYALGGVALVGFHDERDVLQEALQVRELLHGAHELLEVFEASRRVRRFVLLPHVGVAGFLQHRLGDLGLRHGLG